MRELEHIITWIQSVILIAFSSVKGLMFVLKYPSICYQLSKAINEYVDGDFPEDERKKRQDEINELMTIVQILKAKENKTWVYLI